jgi:YVTN family beta-propeller protein
VTVEVITAEITNLRKILRGVLFIHLHKIIFNSKNLSNLKQKIMKNILFLVIILNLLTYTLSAQATLVKKTIIGGEGGWDYLSVSSEDRRLYLSHGNQVEVLNADTHEKIGVIADTKGVHGIVAIPALGKGFITSGGTNSVIVFDTKTLAKLAEIPAGEMPDALLYDKFSERIFVFNHRGGSVTAIDVTTLKAIETVKLGGSAAEAGVTDGNGTIFVNLEDLNEIISFDAKTLAIKNHWTIKPGEEPTGLAVDLKNNLLFAVCGNKKMIVLDAKTGKFIAEASIGGRCDGVVFDPISETAYSSNGEGSITAVHVDSPTIFSVKETIKTDAGARTITIDTKTHHIFTMTAQYGETPPKTTENPRPRPKIVPNTFTVYEFGH